MAIAAIVTGIVALTKIRNEPEAFKGKPFAIAGLVLGSLGIVFCLIGIYMAMDERFREQYGS